MTVAVENVSRRRFARGLVGSVGVALAVAPAQSILGQSLIAGPKPTPSPVSSNLISNAVTVAATSNLTNTMNKLQARTLQSADLAGALVSVKTLFDHMQETGVTDQITKAIIANQTSIVNTGFTQAQIDTQYATISKAGMHITSSAHRNSLITNSAQRQQIITMMKTVGMAGANKEFLAKLALVQGQITTVAVHRGSSRELHEFMPVAMRTDTPRLLRISADEISTCELGAAIFAVGTLFFPALAPISAGMALLAALKLC